MHMWAVHFIDGLWPPCMPSSPPPAAQHAPSFPQLVCTQELLSLLPIDLNSPTSALSCRKTFFHHTRHSKSKRFRNHLDNFLLTLVRLSLSWMCLYILVHNLILLPIEAVLPKSTPVTQDSLNTLLIRACGPATLASSGSLSEIQRLEPYPPTYRFGNFILTRSPGGSQAHQSLRSSVSTKCTWGTWGLGWRSEGAAPAKPLLLLCCTLGRAVCTCGVLPGPPPLPSSNCLLLSFYTRWLGPWSQ